MSSVYLVGETRDGRRCWFSGTYKDEIRNFKPLQIPQFDDVTGKEVSLEFALEARKRWREDFGAVVHVALEKYGPFISDDGSQNSGDDNRTPQFVLFTNGLGLTVTPGTRPDGRCWYVRASDIPSFKDHQRHTAIESIGGATPEKAAQRAVDSWGLEILFRDPDQDARDEAERQRVANGAKKRHLNGARIRPGDRAGTGE
jgi:hypothetical protein